MEETTKHPSKIIILAIYNESPDYIQMYMSHVKYLNHLKQDTFGTTMPRYYFITFKNLGNKDYLVDDKNYMLYIHGRETFLPGILEKTIKAFDIIHNKLKLEYDYIFRTNISTVVHIENTLSYLAPFPNPTTEMYYIGPIVQLQWLDQHSGIIDNRYWGTPFCSGACIILSHALIENIVRNREKLHYNIIDDISIGHYVSQNENIKKISIGTSRFSFKPHNLVLSKTHLCYMNNSNKRRRNIDNEHVRKITEYLTHCTEL